MEIPSVTAQLDSKLLQINKQDANKPVQTPQANEGQSSVGDLAVSEAAKTDKGQQIDTSA
jgi:hypothetical protein